jgi:hypothetical protein
MHQNVKDLWNKVNFWQMFLVFTLHTYIILLAGLHKQIINHVYSLCTTKGKIFPSQNVATEKTKTARPPAPPAPHSGPRECGN